MHFAERLQMTAPSKYIHAMFYLLYYLYIGFFRPFIPPFFHSNGINGMQIGFIFLLISFTNLFAAPIWGRTADKYHLRGVFLTSFPAIAGLLMLPLILKPSFAAALAIAILQGLFFYPLIPLADSICMTRCDSKGWGYGSLRLWGTVGSLISASMGGLIADRYGWTVVMLLMIASTFGISIGGYLLKAPKTIKHKSYLPFEKETEISWMKNPILLLFLGATIFYQTAFGAFHLFYGIFLEDIGASAKWISIGWTFSTISEIAFLSQADKLLKYIGPVRLMGLAMIAGVIRWLGMALFQSLTAAISLQLLHGVMLGGFVAGAVAFAHQIFPHHQKALGQGLHNSAYNGIGGITASLVCGFAYSHYGNRIMFITSACLCIISLILLIIGPGQKCAKFKKFNQNEILEKEYQCS